MVRQVYSGRGVSDLLHTAGAGSRMRQHMRRLFTSVQAGAGDDVSNARQSGVKIPPEANKPVHAHQPGHLGIERILLVTCSKITSGMLCDLNRCPDGLLIKIVNVPNAIMARQ